MQRFPGFGPLIVLHDSRLSIEFVSIPSVVSIEEGVVIFSSSILIVWVTSITSIVEEFELMPSASLASTKDGSITSSKKFWNYKKNLKYSMNIIIIVLTYLLIHFHLK